MDSQFRFLSVSEAAEILGVSGGRIRQLLLAGILKGHKLGEKQWAIDPAEITHRKIKPIPRGRPSRKTLPEKDLVKS